MSLFEDMGADFLTHTCTVERASEVTREGESIAAYSTVAAAVPCAFQVFRAQGQFVRSDPGEIPAGRATVFLRGDVNIRKGDVVTIAGDLEGPYRVVNLSRPQFSPAGADHLEADLEALPAPAHSLGAS